MSATELIRRATDHRDRVAFRSGTETWTYDDLDVRSREIAAFLLEGNDDLAEKRIGFLISASFEYAAAQWGVWLAGGIAVPLSLSATESELEYTLDDAGVSVVICMPEKRGMVQGLCDRLKIQLESLDQIQASPIRSLPNVAGDRRAMILYTSGTTSRPKGVVSTHANIEAQIRSLVQAWHWQRDDCIPLFLPLHHIHGIINILSCALWTGATIEPIGSFSMDKVLQRVREDAYSVFMAVPTIYVKLIETLHRMQDSERKSITDAFAKMRLMISGSAALPASVHQEWTKLTGQRLLERYGMTEIGMALSNPYTGERRAGAVGQPLPGVEIRLKSESGDLVDDEGVSGEIQVRGPSVFHEYWNRSEATEQSFDEGWFCTGDIAVRETGYYRIMGRSSVDIIKSGGYKLSALEIEACLLDHPAINQCAVVGVPDDTWGEAVAVALALQSGQSMDRERLREWCKNRMSKYKIPQRVLVVDSLPRNAMGKVQKRQVAELF